MFRNGVNWEEIKKINITIEGNNFWIWNHSSYKTSIASSVYDFISRSSNSDVLLLGWSLIWKLRVMPRVKIFIWKLAHGRIPTGALLYQLNIGPISSFTLCGLWEKNSDHSLCKCCKVKLGVGMSFFIKLDLNTDMINSLSIGGWLVENNFDRVLGPWVEALIATVA